MSRRLPNRRAHRLQIEALESRVQPAALRPLEVALISDSVAQAGQIQAAAMRGAVAVTYSGATASLDSLVGTLQGISASHGGAPIGHLGFVAHGSQGAIEIGSADRLDMQDVAVNSSTWDRLRNLLTPTARIDLYACDVAAGAAGTAFVNALATRTGADIYASSDAVGNGKGADWTWEYHTAARGASPLFSAAALRKINGLVLEDAYEPNNGKIDADRPTGPNSPNLGVVTGNKTINNLYLAADTEDWFRFDTAGVAGEANYVRIDFINANGDLDLFIYEQDGVTPVGSDGGGIDYQEVSLAGKPAGTYYVKVAGRFAGQGNPKYTLQILAPAAMSDDPFESNNSKADADRPTGPNSPNLGVATGTIHLTHLVSNGNEDWFRFQTAGVSTTANNVRLDMINLNGDLDLFVYEQDGFTPVGSDGGGVDSQVVELAGKPAGTYYIKVKGRFYNCGNADYSLQIVAPAAAPDDPYETNNGKIDADRPAGPNSPNLGTIAGSRTLSNLVSNGNEDWFKFYTTGQGTVNDLVRIDFINADGDLDLFVYESDGVTAVGSDGGGVDSQQVSLAGTGIGFYYVKVKGRFFNTGNASYDLQILTPGSGVSVDPVTVTEGDGGLVNAVFTVLRPNGSGAFSVDYATADSTATTAGNDYIGTSGTLNFAATDTSKTVTVQVRGDLVGELDEYFFVNLSNPSNGVILNNSQTVGTILNDDQGGSLQFSAPTYSVSESVRTAYVKVTRTGGTDGQVTVQYTTDDGSAVAPDDYTSTTGTLTFNNGEVSKTIAIPIVNDSLSEQDESINLILNNPTGGAELGGQSTAELIILTNDKQPGVLQFSASTYSVGEGVGRATITVIRVGGDDGAVSVKYSTAKKTAFAPNDYTTETGVLSFADGETSQTFDIEIINDELFEADESFYLTLGSPTGGSKLGVPRTATLTIANDDVLMTPNTIVAGAGNSGLLKVIDGPTGTVKLTIPAFPTGFKAGLRVATGDVNGDGTVDIIAAPGPNGSTTIRVFDGKTGAKMIGRVGEFAHNLPSAGGVFVAAGDLDGDGKAEIIASAGAGSSETHVFSGLDRSILADFDAFPGSAFGVRVAVGDVTGDGAREIIFGTGEGGTGDVAVFTGGGTFLHGSHPFDGFTGELNVAVGGDSNGDIKPDIIVAKGIAGVGAGAGPHVKVIDGTDGHELVPSIGVYASNWKGGVRVAAGDIDGDGIMELIVGAGVGSNQKVKVIDLATGQPRMQHSPFGAVKTNGLFVACVK